MKKSKKLLIIALGVVIISPLFQSCKKGEEDPFISLRSRDKRITGTWKLNKIEKTTITTTTDVDVDSNGVTLEINTNVETTTTTFDGASETIVETRIETNEDRRPGGQTNIDKFLGDYPRTTINVTSFKETINKDNTYESDWSRTPTSYKACGDTCTAVTGANNLSLIGFDLASDSKTGDWFWADSKKNKIEIFANKITGYVLRLANKELIIQNNTTTNSVSSNYDPVDQETTTTTVDVVTTSVDTWEKQK